MDLTLIESEPGTIPSELGLVLLGVVGYFAVRRWRGAIAIIALAVLPLAWRLLSVLIPMAEGLAMPEVRRYILLELALGLLALFIAICLPTLAWRRRSRPAV